MACSWCGQCEGMERGDRPLSFFKPFVIPTGVLLIGMTEGIKNERGLKRVWTHCVGSDEGEGEGEHTVGRGGLGGQCLRERSRARRVSCKG